MRESCSDHFQASNLRLEHDEPMIFITSEWQYDKDKPSLLYLLLRVAIFIPFFVIWILTITMESPAGRPRWPIYLTNWGLTLCLLQSCMACVLLIGAIADDFMRGKYMWKNTISRLYSSYWVLNVMATSVAFTITIIYWTLIYNAQGSPWSTINFMAHGFNSILMLIDFFAISHPVRVLHFVYPFTLGLAYSIMTALYYIFGGTTKDGTRYIYPILKWDEPGATIGYCIAVMTIMVIIHTLTYLMHKIRGKIAPPISAFVNRKLFRIWDDLYYL